CPAEQLTKFVFPPTRACSGYRVVPTRAIRIAVHPGSRSKSGSLAKFAAMRWVRYARSEGGQGRARRAACLTRNLENAQTLLQRMSLKMALSAGSRFDR